MHTTGTKSYRTYEDIPAHRVVMLRAGTSEPTVELASNDTYATVGVSQTNAKAGEMVSVTPFTKDGSIEITATGSIPKDSLVFIHTADNGTASNNVGDNKLGTALYAVTDGELVTVVADPVYIGQIGDNSTSLEVDHTDTSDYYVGETVHSALEELGTYLETRMVTEQFTSRLAFRTDSIGSVITANLQTIGAYVDVNTPYISTDAWGGGVVRFPVQEDAIQHDFGVVIPFRTRHEIDITQPVTTTIVTSTQLTPGGAQTIRGTLLSYYGLTPGADDELAVGSWHTLSEVSQGYYLSGPTFAANALTGTPQDMRFGIQTSITDGTSAASFFGFTITYYTTLSNI